MIESWFLRQWERNTAWQLLLRPLSMVFGLLVFIRRLLYRSRLRPTYRVAVPVVVVGNLSVGGTGKTPLVIALCNELRGQGFRVGVVSRGFGSRGAGTGRGGGAGVVTPETPAAERLAMGDEVALIVRRAEVPVSVNVDRVEAIRTLIQTHAEINLIVSDDGLQHYAMGRDFEIVVVDSTRGFGNGALMPAGPLREPVSRLKRVSAVVINRTMSRPIGAVDFTKLTGAPVYSMNFGHERFVSVDGAREWSIEEAREKLAGANIIAVAGIGNPHRFFLHLSAIGLSVAQKRAYRDHHAFVAEDFAVDSETVFIMTEKDAVKCEAFATQNMWFMRIEAILPQMLVPRLVESLNTTKAADNVARSKAA